MHPSHPSHRRSESSTRAFGRYSSWSRLDLVIAGMFLVLNWPRGSLAPDAAVPPVIPGATTLGTASPQVSPSPTGQVVVDVAGEVRHPGVCELPAGSRVIDALHAAGGLTHRGDTTSLNLARVLTDGEQVLVPRRTSPTGGGTVPTTSSSSGTGAMVSINTATLEQLDELPGIGPVLAQAIIDYRTQNGPFTSLEQLTDVSGIGDATYADIEPFVTL